MEILNIIFTSLATILIPIAIGFSMLILKTFIGKSIRSPRYPPVVGTLLSQIINYDTLHDYLADIARKTPTYRFLSPDQSDIFTADVRNVEYMLKTNFDNYTKGHINKDIMVDLFGQGIFAVDGAKWKQQRKLASLEFSTRVLRDYSCAVFRTSAAKLVRVVSEFANKTKVFDIQNLLGRCGLDSIMKVGFGVELNCLAGNNEDGNAFINAFDASNELLFFRFVDPLWKLKRFLNIGREASLRKNIKMMNVFVLDKISKRRQQLEKEQKLNQKEDILSRFLIESKNNPEMDDKYLRDVILNFIIAGKDTSMNTISWFFCMVCKHLEVQDKIVSEIQKNIGNKGNTTNVEDFVELITEEVLEKMHYLHATLSETLRLYPPVPLDGKFAEKDDVLPDGYKVKKGEGMYYMSYAMGRMSYIWGDDAEDFKPERWLNDNGVFQPESPFKFVTFHAGPRVCLGRDFAYRQMKILTISLLRFFHFKLAYEKRKVAYKTMFTLHIHGGLHLLAVPRTSWLDN